MEARGQAVVLLAAGGSRRPPLDAPRAAAVNHRGLDEAVKALCEELEVNRYHNPDARRSLPGWPDLVLWGPGGILFVELKSEDGRSTREQLRVANSLRRAGAAFTLWRPEHLENGVIEAELRLLASAR